MQKYTARDPNARPDVGSVVADVNELLRNVLGSIFAILPGDEQAQIEERVPVSDRLTTTRKLTDDLLDEIYGVLMGKSVDVVDHLAQQIEGKLSAVTATRAPQQYQPQPSQSSYNSTSAVGYSASLQPQSTVYNQLPQSQPQSQSQLLTQSQP